MSNVCDSGLSVSILGAFPVEHRRVPNALYEIGSRQPTEIIDQFLTMLPIVGGDSQLHELMPIQRDVELREHGITDARGADAHHRVEMVGPGAQGAFFLS